MTSVNAASATEGLVLTAATDQTSFRSSDPDGVNGPGFFSWITTGGDDVQASGSGSNITQISIDLSNNATNDVLISGITGGAGTGGLTPARLASLTPGSSAFFSELMSFNDTVTGSRFADTIHTGGGSDTLNGGLGADTMNGGVGNDVYIVDNAGDVASEPGTTAGGIDTVLSTASHTLRSGIDNLTLQGGAGITGVGNELANVIAGNAGSNRIDGLAGSDTLRGGGGVDVLRGGLGEDRLEGGDQNDSLFGESANDTLLGGGGQDNLHGGANSDLINGGADKDTLQGGESGSDIFDFDRVTDSTIDSLHEFDFRDVIFGGFDVPGAGLGDMFDLRDIDANELAAGNNSFTFLGWLADCDTPTPAGSVFFTQQGSETILCGNVNASAHAELEVRVADGAVSHLAYSAADILV